MTQQYTPGPWDYNDPHDACCGWACTPNGCHESHPTGIYVVRGPSEADSELLGAYGLAFTNEADARLIAAAPTMAAYIEKLAASGDAEAAAILEVAYGR